MKDGRTGPERRDMCIDALAAWLTELPPRQALALAVACVAGIGLVDYLTGSLLSIHSIYILPVCLTAWSLGRRAGLMTSLICALAGLAANWDLAAQHTGGLIAGWNAVMGFAAFATVALLLSSVRRTFNRERRNARFDPLTGALNMRALHHAISRAVVQAREANRTLILAYVDLDNFKSINDRFGHDAGDEVLRSFTRSAKALLAPEDAVARLGGDEFVLLTSHPEGGDIDAAVQALHAQLASALAALPYPSSFSMGAVFAAPAELGPQDSLIQMADRLMYQVKRDGKNALRIASAASINARARGAAPAARHAPGG